MAAVVTKDEMTASGGGSSIHEKDLEASSIDPVPFTGVVDSKEYGNLERGLKSRHVQFIAIGGMIGTGLFLGTGVALNNAGPLSIFLAFTIVGTVVFAMVQSLGEIVTYLPIAGGLTVYAYRYADPAMGFAMGWNYVLSAGIILCAEISASSIIIGYWNDSIHVAVWIVIILVVIALLNVFIVGSYGEAEFIFASFKIVTILGLLVLAIVLDLGGGPNHDRIGFRYWKNPGAMKEYVAHGNAGRFAGFLKSFVNAVFSFLGAEVIAVAACETRSPRRNIPKAVRRTFWRILFFYVFGVLAIGVLVPSNDPALIAAIKAGKKGAAGSPWVIAIENAGIKGLPHIINAVILSSAWSCGNAFCYAGSRNLYALAISGSAPKIFAKCTKRGIPIYSVLALLGIGCLSFLNIGKSGTVVFGWFVSVTTCSGLFNWFTLAVSYIRFSRGMAAQGISRETLPFKGLAQPYAAWYTIVMCIFILLINGFDVFLSGQWSVEKFFAAYSGIALYAVPYAYARIFIREPQVPYDQMDFFTGKAEIDRMEKIENRNKKEPKGFLERVWRAIA